MRIRKNHRRPVPPFILTLAVVSGSLLHTVVALENGGVQEGGNGLQPMVSRVSGTNSKPKRSIVERAEAPSVLPVDLKNIFPQPLGGTQHFNFEEHHDNNHKGAKDPDPGNDAFAFVVIDGTEGAVYNGFSEAWQVIDEPTEEFKLRKRAWKKARQLDQEAPKDTFEPLQESYRVVCAEGMEAEECKRIFTQGAENTIIKLPQGVGMGPYARVVKFEQAQGASAEIDASNMERIKKRSEAILARRQTDGTTAPGGGSTAKPVVYNIITDYDFAALKVDDKPGAKVQFRCDYSNLVNYWDQAVQQPPNGANSMRMREKRWWGEFIHWIEKVTTMSKQDEGKLEAAYEHDWKLFHFDKSCKKGNTEYKTSLDLDAYINMGMHAHYSYLLHGHILPYPKVENAYGYFSVEPFVKFLLTLEGKGSVTTSTGEKNIIPSIGFPGLSIKGLIRIGPQLDIIGKVDAKLEVSGKVQAGFDIKFPKAQVAFPQTQEGKDHTVAPSGVGKDALKNPKVEPILNAEINAEGTVDFTATPKLSFGIEVLGGLLMKGDVILGVDNTIELGVSANAKADINTGASAEFCYWADYKYRVFIGAEVSFIDNLIDWGKDFNLASPEDPIPIAPKSCVKYGTGSNAPTKRAELPASNVRESIRSKNRRAELTRRQSKPNNSPGLFEGVFSCPAEKAEEDDDQCSPFAPVRKRDLDALDAMPLHRRQTPPGGAAGPACPRNIYPTLFYNCDHFGSYTYTTTNNKASQGPWTAIGICENVKNGIQSRAGTPGFDVNTNSAILTYQAGSGGGNRAGACGGNHPTSTKGCKDNNAEKWEGSKPDRAKGEARWLSCDEFPFNASEEGGSGAVTACVSQAQQGMQGRVNGLISFLRYEGVSYNDWSKTGVKRGPDGQPKKTVKKNGKYKLVLHNFNGASGNTGKVTSPMMARIVGAVNTWDNPKLSFNAGVNNGVCLVSPAEDAYHKLSMLTYKKYGGCQIIFDNPTFTPGTGGSSGSTKRQEQVDENNPDTWIIKDIIMDPNDVFDEDEAIERIGGFGDDQPMNATMFSWEKQRLGN